MLHLITILQTRLRPRAGWPIALLAMAAAGAPGIAARDGALALPAGPLLWGGLLGAALGLRLARPIGRGWRAAQLAACAALGATLLIAAGGALPPPGLLAQDAGAAAGALAAALRGGAAPAPEPLTGRYLALALPRLWRALAAAPGAGEAGAALIVGALAVALTWPAALTLGWAAGGLRRSMGWGLPLLVALALTTILSGAGGSALVLGTGLLLALSVVVDGAARERAWDAGGYAYSELLRPAALAWGGACVAVAVAAALVMPTAVPNFAASLPDADLPSGIAAIEGHVARGQPTPVDPGLSRLPAITLGVSLEQAPPDTVSLRIRTGGPLPAGPYPRYWRARVLNLYTGAAWTSNARRSPYAGLRPDEPLAGAIVQQVEDLRRGGELLVALPDALGLDRAAVAERLPDGSLAALEAAAPGGAYSVVSLPPERAPAPSPAGVPPPSYADTLGLPSGVTQRVRDLAQTIAEGAGGPRERALALEGYLRGLPYSYQVQPLPRGGDAVDQFLFEMRHGYCTYYASAMAVMARSLGIPARVAVGYATGEYDQATGAYTVRERDAHAWPELLIDGRWLAFEPTPALPLPQRDAPAQPPAPAPAPAEAPAPQPGPWLAWALAGLAGAAVALAGWWLGRRARQPALARAQLALERIGLRAGVPWPGGATLHEYGRLLEARGGAALPELIALIEGARYGRRPLSATQERQIRRAIADLRASLRREAGPPKP